VDVEDVVISVQRFPPWTSGPLVARA
jgi:hypothetical protein